MKGLRAVLGVTLLAAGTVAAADVAGTFLLEGPLHLPDGGTVQGRPYGVYLNATERVHSFSAEFPVVRVLEYEKRFVAIGGVLDVQRNLMEPPRVYTLHDVQIRLDAGDAAGFLGLYNATEVALDLVPGSSISPTGLRKYGNAATGNSGDKPGDPFYSFRVSSAHASVIDAGALAHHGAGAMKVMGLDLDIESREGRRVVQTGTTSREEPTPEKIMRWVYLDFPDGVVRVDSAAPFAVAWGEAEASWSGAAVFRPHTGELVIDGDAQPATPANLRVVGDFRASIRVADADGSPRLRLALEGDGDAAGQASRAVPSPLRPSWPLGLIALALALTALGGALALRRRRTTQDLDEMITLAHLAGEGKRHEEALGWIRRARRLAPHSGALALEEAFHLGELGLLDEALAAYAEAARVSNDGQAQFDAALLGHRSGALPEHEVERLLVEALERNPGLVLELQDETAPLPARSTTPTLAAAIRRAQHRLDET